jgi:hypothetical protein
MLYTDEDVSQIKKRAEVLTLLARSDNVSAEQLSLLNTMFEREASSNVKQVPALSEYDRFLTAVLDMQEKERESERGRQADLKKTGAELEERKRRLEQQLQQREELDAQLQEIRDRGKKVLELEQEAQTLKQKISAHEEAAAKLDVDKEVSTLVDNDKSLALQQAELETLERDYLEAEKNVFALMKEISTVGESNTGLLKLCEQLMKKIEAKK